MNRAESVDGDGRTISTSADSAYGDDSASRQGGDATSEISLGASEDPSRFQPSGHYLAYAMPPCSPVMHHRALSMDYARHLGGGQPCYCQAPIAYPLVGNLHPAGIEQHTMPPPMIYPHMIYASPYPPNANYCAHLASYAPSPTVCASPLGNIPLLDKNVVSLESNESCPSTTSTEKPRAAQVVQCASSPPPPTTAPPCLPSPREPTPMSVDSLTAGSKQTSSNENKMTVPLSRDVSSRWNRQSEDDVQEDGGRQAEPSSNDHFGTIERAKYKASVRMDIPYTQSCAERKPVPSRIVQRELQRTTAFSIQFNDDHSTNMVAIDQSTNANVAKLKQVVRKKPAVEATEKKEDKQKEEDLISECGTYVVDEELSYVRNNHLVQEGRKTLLNELIKISNGDAAAAGCSFSTTRKYTSCKSGPASPRRVARGDEVKLSQSFQRTDGGRFSMRAKVTTSPCRSVGGNLPKQQQPQTPSAETLAWLRRKEYNPLARSGVAKQPTDTYSRSKSFHNSPRTTTCRSQPAPASPSSPRRIVQSKLTPATSSLRSQVFVELGSLKRLQVLSVDLMTLSTRLKEKLNRLAGVDEHLTASQTTVIEGDTSCPLSDVIKKLSIVERALKFSNEFAEQIENQSSTAEVFNESQSSAIDE